MRDLELQSLHADGEHLILTDPEGGQYRLPIDEALRLAVRRDRPQLEALRAQSASTLRPREIQARIRAGAGVADVAAEGGLPLEAVRRYEGPVRAEQAWIVEQTRALPIGHEVGAPTLGDLVVDRLAARGVEGSADWEALRRQGEPWEVSVVFLASGTPRRAAWQVDLQARSLTALDDESRWLSETDLTGRRGRGNPFDVESDGNRRGADVVIRDSSPPSDGARQPETAATDVLLDRLTAARGRRVPEPASGATAASESSETHDGGDSPSPASSSPVDDALFPVAPVLRLHRDATSTAASTVDAADVSPAESADEPGDTPGDASDTSDATPARPGRSRQRARRTSVPSWDEIVFGSRQE